MSNTVQRLRALAEALKPRPMTCVETLRQLAKAVRGAVQDSTRRWEEAKHPRAGNGRFSRKGETRERETQPNKISLQSPAKSGKVLASGANKFKVREFVDKASHKYHVNKHLKEFPGMTEMEYVAAGIALLEKPVTKRGIRGYKEPNGTITRYDPEKHWYAVGEPNYGMWSFYTMPPEVFEGKRKRVLRHGGTT